MAPPEKLSDIAIQRALGTLNGWSRRGDALVKTYAFRTFPEAVGFVNRIAGAAEAMDHHPDLDIRFNKVTATLSTHSADGITQNDFDLAARMDELEKG